MSDVPVAHRRRLLRRILLATVALPAILIAGMYLYAQSERTVFVNETVALENPLHIPPILEPDRTGGRLVFDLVLQAGRSQFVTGGATASWGVNGAYLGPTIRVRTGDRVAFRVSNALDEPTTLHWHGMHLPAAMDGGPHQAIGPGETWRPHWTVANQAATLWYHPHLMGKTAEHVYRGLAGLLIVEDENSERLDIPKTYGVDDLPVIVQDRAFDEAGRLVYEPTADGFFGNVILVNGTYAPYAEVPRGLVRLRLLNASNARRYSFGFDDGRRFRQIATDGGFLEAPVELARLVLLPGERAEIVVDMSGGGAVTLMSYAVVEDDDIFVNFGKWYLGAIGDENEVFKILELRGRPSDAAPSPLPERLNAIARWTEADAARTRRFVLDDDHTINDRKMDPRRVDEIVRTGDVEVWEIHSRSIRAHPFHVHGLQFLLLDRDGVAPPAHERGWKDTVAVARGETVRLAMRFPSHSDPTLPYMYHCHLLEHEDSGMMGQFVVVDDPAVGARLRPEAAGHAAGRHGH
jgi:bilirubin oxidase